VLSRRGLQTALAVVLLALAAWSWQSAHHWVAVLLFAAGAAFPLAQSLVRVSAGKASPVGLPSVAIQPAILVLLVLILGVGEIAGIGFRQDTGRGMLALVGAGFGAYGVLLLARAFRSRD
jgi:hypothetical protein